MTKTSICLLIVIISLFNTGYAGVGLDTEVEIS